MTFLDKVMPGQRAKIVGYTEDTPLARRLIELGLVPGRTVTHLRNAPLRDPMEIQVGTCCLSLRHAEAARVTVELAE
jgi:Fe2+ transport system protein FeoA